MAEVRRDDAGPPPMAVVSRRQQRMDTAPAMRGDDREARLVEVAEDLLRRGEFEATSISRIAADSGLSRPGFYFYFSSKDELLGQVALRHLSTMLDDVDRWLEEGGRSPGETILGVLRRTAENWRQHPEALRAGVEVGPRVPAVQAGWQAVTARGAEAVSRYLGTVSTDPGLRDPEAARRVVTAIGWMVERSFYMHYQAGGDAEEEEALIRTLHGVIARAFGLPDAAAVSY